MLVTLHYMDTATFYEQFKELEDGCKVWTRAKVQSSKSQYGVVWHEGTKWLTHRLAWTLANGAIPDGMHINHKCQVTTCGNVDHLEVLTPVEHARTKPPDSRARALYCKAGHRFLPENTYWYTDKRGYDMRACKECRRRWAREGARRRRKRAKDANAIADLYVQ